MSLASLPLFPLQTVLFPGGLLPLQIFEVRYLDLMKRCERSGEPFGVVCLHSGQEVRRAGASAGTESLATIGTLATLARIAHPRPGLILIEARGTQRFRLDSTQQLPHGLWTGAAQVLPDDAPAAVPAELASLGPRLRGVLQALSAREGSAHTLPAPSDDPRWQDAGWPIAGPSACRSRWMSARA